MFISYTQALKSIIEKLPDGLLFKVIFEDYSEIVDGFNFDSY
jgi:hypothetical protein